MISLLARTACVVIVLWAFGKFVILQLPMVNVQLTSPGAVTAIVCVGLAGLSIVTSILVGRK